MECFDVHYYVVCSRCGSPLDASADLDRHGSLEVTVDPCSGCECWLRQQITKQLEENPDAFGPSSDSTDPSGE